MSKPDELELKIEIEETGELLHCVLHGNDATVARKVITEMGKEIANLRMELAMERGE